MTATVLVLLAIVVLIGVAIAWELLRLRRNAPAELDPDEFEAELSRLHKYEPLQRLLGDGDFSFVDTHPGLRIWKRKLRLRRRRIIGLYLRDIRSDFNRVWSICRLLAPMNPDPGFSTALIRQLFVFYAYYAAIHACCLFGCYCYIPVEVGGLVRGMKQLGEMASETLANTDALAFRSLTGSGR